MIKFAIKRAFLAACMMFTLFCGIQHFVIKYDWSLFVELVLTFGLEGGLLALFILTKYFTPPPDRWEVEAERQRRMREEGDL